MNPSNLDPSLPGPLQPAPPPQQPAPKRKRDHGTALPYTGATGLSIVEAPETARFRSPLPNLGDDKRNPPSKTGKWQDMTARGGAGNKRSSDMVDLADMEDEDEDEEEGGGKRKYSNKRNATSTGRRKIDIEYIDDKSKRHVSFTKRKAGLMKKAYELSTLTGTNCLVLVVSETGLVYTYATPGLKPVIAHEDGKAVIAASLRGDLKIDDPEFNAASVLQRGKATAKSAEPEEEPREEAEGDLMINDQQEHELLPLPDLSHITEQQHRMFNEENGMMDPALRYFGDLNQLFESSSSSAAAHSLPALVPASMPLPPLPFTGGAEAPLPHQHHQAFPYSIPAFQPGTTAEAPTSNARAEQTPLERAQVEHAHAFASYQSKSTNPYAMGRPQHGAHEFGEVARNWLPTAGGAARGEGTAGAAGQQGESMEERRKAWKSQADTALTQAAQERSIHASISAHFLSHLASLAIPPPRNQSVLPARSGVEETLQLLQGMCAKGGITSLDDLPAAAKYFLETYLPSTRPSFTSKQINEARQHLIAFYDFLEGHLLISTTEAEQLSSFNASRPLDPVALAALSSVEGRENDEEEVRAKEVELALGAWSTECRSKFEDKGRVAPAIEPTEGEELQVDDIGALEGWFEVYRVRGNFALLKDRELQGDPAVVPQLLPVKVRFPRSLTPKLKIEDAVWLKIRKVLPAQASKTRRASSRGRAGHANGDGAGESWVPVQSGSFHPAPLTSSNVESDIDPTSYADELDSMLLNEHGTAEDDDNIREHRETLGMLRRAKSRLASGEVSD